MTRSRKAAEGQIERREALTEVIRVPNIDWHRIMAGRATEFRVSAHAAPTLPAIPSFAVLYLRNNGDKVTHARLMTITAMREEALGAITAEGLAAAGYHGPVDDAYALFRREWRLAHRKFEPLAPMRVFTVRPVRATDRLEVGAALIDYLYEDHLASSQLPRQIKALPRW